MDPEEASSSEEEKEEEEEEEPRKVKSATLQRQLLLDRDWVERRTEIIRKFHNLMIIDRPSALVLGQLKQLQNQLQVEQLQFEHHYMVIEEVPGMLEWLHGQLSDILRPLGQQVVARWHAYLKFLTSVDLGGKEEEEPHPEQLRTLENGLSKLECEELSLSIPAEIASLRKFRCSVEDIGLWVS